MLCAYIDTFSRVDIIKSEWKIQNKQKRLDRLKQKPPVMNAPKAPIQVKINEEKYETKDMDDNKDNSDTKNSNKINKVKKQGSNDNIEMSKYVINEETKDDTNINSDAKNIDTSTDGQNYSNDIKTNEDNIDKISSNDNIQHKIGDPPETKTASEPISNDTIENVDVKEDPIPDQDIKDDNGDLNIDSETNKQLWTQIMGDVNRTFQHTDIFRDKTTKRLFGNILYVWSRENIKTGYFQGMHDLASTMLISVLFDIDIYKRELGM